MSGQDPSRNRACTDERNISGDGCEKCTRYLGGGELQHLEDATFAETHNLGVNESEWKE